MRRCGIALALLLLPIEALMAESLTYAIYALPLIGGHEIVAEGTRVYSLQDVKVENRNGHESKSIDVGHGFSVGASVYREKKITGFGFWMDKNGEGFSWEWFDLEEGDIFRKRQGRGRVKVTMKLTEGAEEMARVAFLDEVTFRLQLAGIWRSLIPFVDRHTHHMVIGKGSELVLAAH